MKTLISYSVVCHPTWGETQSMTCKVESWYMYVKKLHCCVMNLWSGVPVYFGLESVQTAKPHITDQYLFNYCSVRNILLYLALELKEAVLNSDQEVMAVSEVDMIHDIKSWLVPHINTPHGHTNPHNFLFRLGESEKAEMQYRNWSTDSWLPLAPEPGVVLLKVSTTCDWWT